MDQWTNGPMENGPMNQWTIDSIDQWNNGPRDQCTNIPIDQCTNGPTDQWTNGPVDQWTNGPIDQWTIITIRAPVGANNRDHLVGQLTNGDGKSGW